MLCAMTAAPASAPPILPAGLEHAPAFASYIVQHMAESGRGGLPHFSVTTRLVASEVRPAAEERWRRALDQPQWARAWLMWTGEPPPRGPAGFYRPPARVIGHVELRGGRVPAELHRATLALGMLEPYTGKGHGRRLIEVAIAWARDVARLAYLDLGVLFEMESKRGNERARQLYARMGFVEQGARRDAFRVDGVAIDELQMTLALQSPPRP